MPTFTLGPSQTVKQLTPGKAALVLLVLGIAGVLITVFGGIPMAKNALESGKWPSVEGVIKISNVTSNQDSSDNTMTYGADVAYDYTVDAVLYAGSNVTFGDYSSGDPGHARNIANQYPVGKTVSVYYNPDNPATSVLEPGAKWSSFMVAGIGILFILIGFLGSFFSFKKFQQGKGGALPTSPPAQ